MSTFKDMAGGWLGQARAAGSRWKNRSYADAFIASAAIVAYADGTLDPKEKKVLAEAIANFDALKDFSAQELYAQFLGHESKATNAFGRLDLLKVVGRIKGDEKAGDIVFTAIQIAKGDGTYGQDEKDAIVEICAAAGVEAPAGLKSSG